jgi:hypothetical protein
MESSVDSIVASRWSSLLCQTWDDVRFRAAFLAETAVWYLTSGAASFAVLFVKHPMLLLTLFIAILRLEA